jgi:hypothetical protein
MEQTNALVAKAGAASHPASTATIEMDIARLIAKARSFSNGT